MSARKGQSKPEYSLEEKRKIVERVCELYETQHATLESCCEAAGISSRSFFLWVGRFAEFAERYKKTKQIANDFYWQEVIAPKAQTALERLLEGEEWTETELRDLADKGLLTGDRAETVKTGKSQPNVTAVIFSLKGEFPERFADRSLVNMQVQTVEGETLAPETLDEIERHLAAKRKSDEDTSLPGKSKGQR